MSGFAVDPGGVLPSARVQEWCASHRTGVDKLMLDLLPLAASFAQAPVSSFQVGAVVAGTPPPGAAEPALYLGANLEFAGEALGFSLHAEQAAVLNAWQAGETRLSRLATSAPPCGHCRQFLHELAGAAQLRLVTAGRDPQHPTVQTLAELLPHPFGPHELGMRGGLLDPDRRSTPLRIEPPTEADDPLVAAALEAASHSYAPYTDGHAGAAVQTVDGRIAAGRLAENAAFNPSLTPLAAAASRLVFGCDPEAGPVVVPSIARAVLVEAEGRASQRRASAAMLAALAPGLELDYRRAVR